MPIICLEFAPNLPFTHQSLILLTKLTEQTKIETQFPRAQRFFGNFQKNKELKVDFEIDTFIPNFRKVRTK